MPSRSEETILVDNANITPDKEKMRINMHYDSAISIITATGDDWA